MDLLVIRNSELSSYRACRQRWYWSYRLHWKPKRKAVPLRFGDLIHQALAGYYLPEDNHKRKHNKPKRGPHPAAAFIELYETSVIQLGEMGMYADEAWIDARTLGEEMMVNYIDEYGLDPDYIIVAPEVDFQLDIYDEDGYYICTFVGTIDAVMFNRRTGRLMLFEHKTAASIRTDHLPLDEQAGTYLALGPVVLRERGLLDADQNLDGILYNFLRKAQLDTRPTNDLGQRLNQDGTVSKKQPPPLFERVPVHRGLASGRAVLQRIIDEATEIDWIDQGEMKVVKNPTWDCARCEFFGPCVLHEDGQDYEELLRLEYEQWDPYQTHNGKLLPAYVEEK